ncbi:MAG TPA: S1 RNA-binding domain-containing protein [Acetomicrobium flavidum]|uniref:30S ribosomal protein S1 n=1 Tax=Acetomicrobium flavidum TaxID=49896 RepID=UPI002CE6B4B8|nr:S1 RNA-binding domain-containing protein [Acetomicrobium flavidum]
MVEEEKREGQQEIGGEAMDLPPAQENQETMEELITQHGLENVHRGKVVEGVIIDSTDDGWLVDIGFKCEGFLPKREWTHRILVDDDSDPSVGDRVRAEVTRVVHGEESQVLLSRWRLLFDERWNDLENALKSNETIKVVGLRKVKGGLVVNAYGLEGFIPISHLAEEGKMINPSKFINQEIEVKLLEKDRRKRRLIFSRRLILEQEMANRKKEFFENVKVGDILEGVVTSITSFGVFVDLGPIEGLVHISELSWSKNVKPRDIVKKGSKVKVKVLSVDPEQEKISLSIKQTEPDPWEVVGQEVKPGDRLSGRVTNTVDFGAFVEIKPGVEGLIHISDISWGHIDHPREVLKKGQEIEVQVLDVDVEQKRISLGYKQLHDPWETVAERYQPGQDVTVKVVKIVDFGAFVEIEKGVEGLIHISQISKSHVSDVSKVLKRDDEIRARVLEVDPKEKRIRLSIKALEEEEEKQHQQGERDKKEEKEGKEAQAPRESKNSHQAQESEEGMVTIGDVLKGQLKV